MKFCSDHWEQLRVAIRSRGLDALVAESGAQAARNLTSEASEGATIDNFDPLMGAHNYIMGNAMDTISDVYRQNSLMLFADENEHPEWACPICALNWCHAEHDRLCTQEGCNYPKAYDWSESIDKAADVMLAEWKKLGGRESR